MEASVAIVKQYPAEVISVYDGDTVHLFIEVGLGVTLTGASFEGERCRFVGTNSPEMNTPEGRAAKTYLQTLLGPGDKVTVQTPNDHRDNYGRPLVTIIRSDGMNVNQQMITAGQAVPYNP
jgi:endonuclease YncB( thermonuclease family)